MSEQNRYYQITCLLSPLLDEKAVSSVKQKIKGLIEERQGKIQEEKITKKSLSYPIRKFQQSFRLILNFFSNPSAVDILNEHLPLEKDILRYLITIQNRTNANNKPRPVRIPPKKIEKNPEPTNPLPKPATTQTERSKKVRLEELDKKLEEILAE